MKSKMLLTIFMSIFMFIIAVSLSGENTMNDYISLYDFNETEVSSQYEWEGFTDQVMGGKSEISTRIMSEDAERFIRMEGDVSLKNNGGFIQISLRLARGLNAYNALDYDGIRLNVRGQDSGYYIFIRTSSTILPWQFFKAEVDAEQQWRTIDIPWTSFTAGDYGTFGRLNPAKLKSVALVAYGKEFKAEIDLKRIGLYNN